MGLLLKIKNGNEITTTIAKIIRDDRRCPKNLHYGKRILHKRAKTLEKNTT